MEDNYYLMKEQGNNLYYSPVRMLDNPNLSVLDHEIREEIMRALAEKPMFAAQIARELGLHEQKVYYHIKQLINTGLLEEAGREEIRGTVAKRYKPTHMSFAYSMSTDWKQLDQFESDKNAKLMKLLDPFIKDGSLNADIVVGSPDKHGPYKSYARDGHYATDLALFLGKFCDISEEFSVKLDVDVKGEKTFRENMIIVGGPGTNVLTEEINPFLKIKFDIKEAEHGFLCSGIVSEKTGRRSTEDNSGIIARVPNPYNADKSILLLAGLKRSGTKTAVLGLTRYPELVLEKYDGGKEFAAIVDGYDMSGDGNIDTVELIE